MGRYFILWNEIEILVASYSRRSNEFLTVHNLCLTELPLKTGNMQTRRPAI